MEEKKKNVQVQIKILVYTDLVDSTKILSLLGDAKSMKLSVQHDETVRKLIQQFYGTEIEKTDGFCILFHEIGKAVHFSLQYHHVLGTLSKEIEIQSRIGIYAGQITLVEALGGIGERYIIQGHAKNQAERLMSLACGNQSLMNRTALELLVQDGSDLFKQIDGLTWENYGPYQIGSDQGDVIGVGIKGTSEFRKPIRNQSNEKVSSWIPVQGTEIPFRQHWVLEKKLSKADSCHDWLAIHKKTGDRRLFKFAPDEVYLKALKREVAVFRLLKEELGQRKDLTEISDWNFEEPPFFLELDISDHQTLLDYCKEKGGVLNLDLEHRLELARQIAEALDAVHSVGVLHKSLDPVNILVKTDEGGKVRVKLTNFGKSLITDPGSLEKAGITSTGLNLKSFFNKPLSLEDLGLYLAPELLAGKRPTLQSDIYALGVLLFQLAAGDFTRTVTSGWQASVKDPFIQDIIEHAVEGMPEKRLSRPIIMAEALRDLSKKREQFQTQKEKEGETALQASAGLKHCLHQNKKLKTAVVILATTVLFLTLFLLF